MRIHTTGSPAAAAGEAPADEVAVRDRPRVCANAGVALLTVVASILSWSGFRGVRPREMGELGLLPDIGTAVVLLLGTTLVCLHRHRPGWVVGTHRGTYPVLSHGRLAVLYETAR